LITNRDIQYKITRKKEEKWEMFCYDSGKKSGWLCYPKLREDFLETRQMDFAFSG